MLFGEVADAFAFQIEDAHHAVLHHQRHSDFRTNIRVRGDVAGIGQCVLDTNRFALCGGSAGNSLPQRNIVEQHALIVTFAEPVAERTLFGIDQKNTEGVVVDERADGLGDFAEQLIELQDGGKLLREMGQDFRGPVLALDALVEPCIVDRGDRTGGQQPQQRGVLLGESILAGGLEIDDTDQFAAGHHGHGEFGANRIDGADVAWIGADIGHQNGLPGGGGNSRQSFAQLQDHVLDHFIAMAARVAQPQALHLVVVKKDGEQVVRDNPGDEVGQGWKQAVEVQRLRGNGRDFEQEVEQFRAFLEPYR